MLLHPGLALAETGRDANDNMVETAPHLSACGCIVDENITGEGGFVRILGMPPSLVYFLEGTEIIIADHNRAPIIIAQVICFTDEPFFADGPAD